MNTDDHPAKSSHDEAEVSTQQAEPYRTPQTVPDSASRRGLLGSPIVWLIAGVVLVGAGVFALSPRRSGQTDVINYVEDFGDMRRGPVEEENDASAQEIEAYEVEIQAASPMEAP